MALCVPVPPRAVADARIGQSFLHISFIGKRLRRSTVSAAADSRLVKLPLSSVSPSIRPENSSLDSRCILGDYRSTPPVPPVMTKIPTPVTSSDLTEEFVQLLTANQPRIFSFVLALVANQFDAEEIVQETSVILWRRFAEYQRGTNFRAWACQIARFKVLEFRRSNPDRAHLVLTNALQEQIAMAALEQADDLELRRLALFECLQQLHARDRDLIERRMRIGSTVPQIAQEIGRPVAGLYKAFERIYRSLHECIDRKIAREAPLEF